jgi:hypothetical protein
VNRSTAPIVMTLLGVDAATSAPAAYGGLSVNTSSPTFTTVAATGTPPDDRVQLHTVTNGFSDTHVASLSGISASTSYDFDWTTNGGLFSWDFDFDMPGVAGYTAASATEAAMEFTVTDQDLQYDFSGFFDGSGVGVMSAAVALIDLTAGTSTFNWTQTSVATPDESFVVGQTGDGDLNDSLQGAASGTLLAGHTYSLTYAYFISSNGVPADGASALGALNMQISSNVVPAPGAAVLGLLGTGLVGWWERRG